MTLELKTKQAVFALAPKANKLIIALSGGADSVALVKLLESSGYKLELAHLDHSLREQSLQDAEFVSALGQHLNLNVHIERLDVKRISEEKGWNLEDAARKLRYAFLTRVAKQVKADVVVTAHTQDDQAETVLMQLLRGAAYLKGMPSVQKNVIRPLLNVSKVELLAYLELKKQDYVTDQSNFDTSYTRAWLRNEMLPQLEKRYPVLKKTLSKLASLQTDQALFIEETANLHSKEGQIDLSKISQLAPALQRQIIVKLLKESQLSSDFSRIESIRQWATTITPKRLSLSKQKEARSAYGTLRIVSQSKIDRTPQAVTKLDQLPEGLKADSLNYPDLVFRYRRAGDRINLSGGTKKLKDVLINKKIPQEDRDSLKLLASGNNVLWVEGIAVNPSVSTATQNDDIHFMQLALKEAQKAFDQKEMPVGAVITRNGQLIAKSHNQTERLKDPTAHAELLAIKEASKKMNNWRLTNCTLYVTLEPCPMCFGAIQQAHIDKVVFGASKYREGALGSVSDLNGLDWKRKIKVEKGVLVKPSSHLLSSFFELQRTKT